MTSMPALVRSSRGVTGQLLTRLQASNASPDHHRGVAAYLGLALGDALGATVEFMTPREIASNYGIHDRIRGGGWLRLKPGQVTDDTTMSLYLGKAILADSGRVVADSVATAFDCWMRRRPVDIGHTVRRGIVRYRQTGEPQVPQHPEDAGNGGCMRLLPAVLASSDEDQEAAVLLQARVTHHHPLADAGTLCVGRMIARALRGGDRNALLDPAQKLVRSYPEFAFRGPREENPSGYIVHTLRAVFQAFFETDSFEACLVDVVNRGGDADTTGAIAGMLAGAFYGPSALPWRWLRALDPTIRQSCVEQALALQRFRER